MIINKLNEVDGQGYNLDYTLYVSNNGVDTNSGSSESSPITLLGAYNRIQNLAKNKSLVTIKLIDDITIKETLNFNGFYPVVITSNDEKTKRIFSSANFDIISNTETECIITTTKCPRTLLINNTPIFLTEDCSYNTPQNFVSLIDSEDYTFSEENKYIHIPLTNISGVIPNIDSNTIIRIREAWWTGFSYKNTKTENELILETIYSHKNYLVTKYNHVIKLQFSNLNINQKGRYYYTYDEETQLYTIHYIKKEIGEQITSVIIPNLETLISINKACGIKFLNISFLGSELVDYSYSQANANRTNAAVKISDSSYIDFDNCDFIGIGNYCLSIINKNYNITVKNSRFINTYGGGILVFGNTSIDSSERLYDSLFYNNIIAHIGNFCSEQVGILIMSGDNISIDHCEIFDTYYTAISLGWKWGYYVNNFPTKVLVSNCHIHHCMQMVSADGGAIYMLGDCTGTILEGNCIHDIYPTALTDAAKGIYFDEGSRGIMVRYNTIFSCGDLISTHYGSDNFVINNIIAYEGLRVFGSARTAFNIAYYILANIVISENIPFTEIQPILICNNIFCSSKQLPVTKYHYDNGYARNILFKNQNLGNFTYVGENTTIGISDNNPKIEFESIAVNTKKEYPCSITMEVFKFPHDSIDSPGVISSIQRNICVGFNLGDNWDIEQRQKIKDYFGISNNFLNYTV